MSNDFSVRFWGVRGSIACSAPDIVRYGGNTSCLEIRCGDRTLIFDGGTGLRYLGLDMVRRGLQDVDIFFTHTHLDHVCGLPFFVPFFIKGNTFRLHAGNLLPDHTLFGTMSHMMMAPLFPIPPSIFSARLSFHDFHPGETKHPYPGVTLRTAPLNHPNGATGYRVDFDGRSICYLTDTEHFPDRLDDNILTLIDGADIVIYDAMYTEAEYATRKGWGHSTWHAGVELCNAARVKTFVVFHHDPDHNDDFMDRVAAEVETLRPGTLVAREGMVLRP
jgi:phosphoribosyl 1,2-cyclic phosphodiesterase